jgi:hypothetical protein
MPRRRVSQRVSHSVQVGCGYDQDTCWQHGTMVLDTMHVVETCVYNLQQSQGSQHISQHMWLCH